MKVTVSQTAKTIYDFLARYKTKVGKFPKLDLIQKYLKLDINEVRAGLRELEQNKIIHRNHAKYKVQDTPKPEVKVPITDYVKKVKSHIPTNMGITLLLIGCFITGVGSGFISIYYSFVWFQVVMPIWAAAMVAVFWVIFMVISFEVGVLLFQKYKSWKRIFSVGPFLLYFFMAFYSMSSTMAGQYNEMRDQLKQESKIENKESGKTAQLQLAKDSIEAKKEQIRTKQEQIKFLQKSISSRSELDDKGEIDWNKRNMTRNDRKEIARLETEIDKLMKDIETKYEKQDILYGEGVKIEEVKLDKGTYYEWLEEILHIPAILLQFFLSIFPAIFFDIVSPVAFYFMILLKEKEAT